MFRMVSSVTTLFLFWVVLSGYFTPFLLCAGLASSVAVVWLAHRMAVLDQEGHPVHLGLAAMGYWPWLVKEIVKSAWDVTRIILSPSLPVESMLVRVKPTQKSEVGLATYANSITLTPGTISIKVARNEFLVHALTAAGAEGLRSGDMDARVTRLEART